MAINTPQLHLICYDIADPRRLGRVHRYLSSHAIPLQYSVFLANMKPTAVSGLVTELEEIIDLQEDDIRIYPLPGALDMERIGAAYLPEGIRLLNGDCDLVSLCKVA